MVHQRVHKGPKLEPILGYFHPISYVMSKNLFKSKTLWYNS